MNDPQGTPPRRLRIIVNPASGKDEPVLAELNRALAHYDIDWDVVVTQANRECAAVERAIAEAPDLIAVYGGDGTVSRVATILLATNSTLPIAVLSGGTANALAESLGTSGDIEDIVAYLASGQFRVQPYDVGWIGDRAFLLRVSIGAAAGLTHHATREQKERYGVFAYALSTLHAMTEIEPKRYRLQIDDQHVEQEAIACIVANSPGTGIGMPLASGVNAHDAKLDVVLVPDLRSVSRVLANAATNDGLVDGLPRWVGRNVEITTSSPEPVHVDGEPLGTTPVTLTTRSAAVHLAVLESRKPYSTDQEERSTAPTASDASRELDLAASE